MSDTHTHAEPAHAAAHEHPAVIDPHAPPSEHDIHHIEKHLKLYWTIGGVLGLFTVITVALSYADFDKWLGGHGWDMVIGMIVATLMVMMFAGLYENWKQPDGEWLQTFALITRAAVDPMSQLHDRTPLMLQAPALAGWLHGDASDAAAIANEAVPPRLVWHPVARAVSNPRSNGRGLINPVPLPPPPEPEAPRSASLFD